MHNYPELYQNHDQGYDWINTNKSIHVHEMLMMHDSMCIPDEPIIAVESSDTGLVPLSLQSNSTAPTVDPSK